MTTNSPDKLSSPDVPQRKTERRKIADLTPHPQQAYVFGDLPQHRLEQLAQSIDQRGVDYLPQILPDGTILRGCQRVRAQALRGETEIDVLVRYDLADDPLQADREFLEDNLLAKQLSPMQKVRAYTHLVEVYRKEPPDPLVPSSKDRVPPERQLANELDGSRKNLKRYLDTAKAPLEVQDAFDRGEVKLEHAARIGRLPQDQKDAIAEAIRDGESPREVVADYIVEKSTPRNGPTDRFSKLIEVLDDAENLRGQPLPTDVIVGVPELETLRNSLPLITELQGRVEQLMKARREKREAESLAG